MRARSFGAKAPQDDDGDCIFKFGNRSKVAGNPSNSIRIYFPLLSWPAPLSLHVISV
jgi:hypothetical protein